MEKIEKENNNRLWSVYTKDESRVVDGKCVDYTEYSIYINNYISSSYNYDELFNTMRDMNSNDILHFHINSNGGDVITLNAFSSAFEDCKAEITCYVDGNALSCAFIMAFMGDHLKIYDQSLLMCHNILMSTHRQNITKCMNVIDIYLKQYRKMLKKYCSEVLSEEEINNVTSDDIEIYLTKEDIVDRIKNKEFLIF